MTAKRPAEAPAFTSDRMRLMAPFLSPAAIALGQRRIFEKGFKLIKRIKLPTGGERIDRATENAMDLKGALLVAKTINPSEILNGEEDAIFYGADRGTISGMRARGELGD